MEIDLDQLPDCPEALKQLVVKVVTEHQHSVDVHRSRIQHLEEALRLMKQQRYGRSSEKIDGQGELSFFNEAELLDSSESEDESNSTEVKGYQRKPKGSRGLPDSLPRVEIVYDLSDDEKVCDCGQTLRLIGEEVLEQLAVIPQQRFVRRHVKRKYACSCKRCVRTARMPKQPLPGTQASPQLIAQVAVSKYLDGLPLYRQEKMAKRDGLALPRAMLARWLIGSAKLAQPIINLLQDALFAHDITWSDDTSLQVLKENGRRAESKSYLWIRRGGPPHQPVVLVDYSPSRSGLTAYGLLQHCRGYLVCDAYPGYNRTLKANGLEPVYCNDHARRRFVEALKRLDTKKRLSAAPLTERALEYYRTLYRIEAELKGREPLDALQHRQLHAVPVWDEFIAWAQRVLLEGVVDTGTRDALKYLLKHADGLRRYCTDARLPISNILSEHVAKTIALARKNFLFADTPAGAAASAALYSLLETAKANHHHPHRYLSVLFAELPNAGTVAEYEALLPWNISPEDIERRYAAFPSP